MGIEIVNYEIVDKRKSMIESAIKLLNGELAKRATDCFDALVRCRLCSNTI